MAFNDILLHIDTYPEPTSEADVRQAVDFVKLIGGRVTALGVAVHVPLHSNRLADYLLKLSEIAHEAEARSHAESRARLAVFTELARAAGVLGDALDERADLFDYSDYVARRAMVRDLCMVPLGGHFGGQIEVAQEAVFGSGRPVLAFKAGEADLPAAELGAVVVAWDGSRFAARALQEALPILKQAREVRVLTVVNDKPSAVAGMGAEPVRHLKAHGVAAVADEIDSRGEPIGAVLDRYVRQHEARLVVMGAYGHSRLREFILGGATEHVLSKPAVPVFLAH